MDQGGSSLGLTPFVRCHTDELPLTNSVYAFQMILYLLFRTLSVLLCSSREVSSSGLYGRRSSTQSRYFLIINIHNIGAKVRAVELTGKNSFHPSRILVISNSPMLLEHRGHLLKRFGCRKTLYHCFSVLARMGRFRTQCDRRAFSSEAQPQVPPDADLENWLTRTRTTQQASHAPSPSECFPTD